MSQNVTAGQVQNDSLDVALIQTELIWQDAAANRELLQPLLWQASGADLIVLPETFNSGFSMQSDAIAEPEGDTLAWLIQQSALTGAALCGSVATRSGDDCVNRCYFVTPQGQVSLRTGCPQPTPSATKPPARPITVTHSSIEPSWFPQVPVSL